MSFGSGERADVTQPRRPLPGVWLLYAGVYGWFLWSFGRKVADYVADVWRHFEFVRNWFA